MVADLNVAAPLDDPVSAVTVNAAKVVSMGTRRASRVIRLVKFFARSFQRLRARLEQNRRSEHTADCRSSAHFHKVAPSFQRNSFIRGSVPAPISMQRVKTPAGSYGPFLPDLFLLILLLSLTSVHIEVYLQMLMQVNQL